MTQEHRQSVAWWEYQRTAHIAHEAPPEHSAVWRYFDRLLQRSDSWGLLQLGALFAATVIGVATMGAVLAAGSAIGNPPAVTVSPATR